MNVICVDDEKLLADYVAELCRSLPKVDQALSFSSSLKALEWLRENDADLADIARKIGDTASRAEFFDLDIKA